MDHPKPPQYVGAADFYRSINVHFEVGTKLIKAGVLVPDAYLNHKPIFLADLETVQRAKAAIALYRLRRNNRLENAKELMNA